MSDTPLQSPLGINSLGSLLQNSGFRINPSVTTKIGTSISDSNYVAGSIVNNTVLSDITSVINLAYNNLILGNINNATYTALLSIGSSSIPALANGKPSTYTTVTTDSTNRYGFLRLIALQAYNEFNYNTNLPAYSDFLESFNSASNFIDQTNSIIFTASNSINFIDGIYSNMNDLITGDVAGVSLSMRDFGLDLITLGKAIDLSSIGSFGLPSNLLRIIKNNNSFTDSLGLAILSSGITLSDLENIISIPNVATPEQERNLYGAFSIIIESDLEDILIPLNCKTKTIEKLSDLLDPKKLFPNSFNTLTVPVYNATASITNSKTYYPIYVNGGVNSMLSSDAMNEYIGPIILDGSPQIVNNDENFTSNINIIPSGFGSYLNTMIPEDIAVACGAFGRAMLQIRGISNIEIEKFAQVVFNLETTKNLSVNGTTVPTNTELAGVVTSTIAKGSGPKNSYTMSDFFGCMSGLPYKLSDIESKITSLNTTSLKTIYQNMSTLLNGGGAPYDAALLVLIASANTAISNIKSSQPLESAALNTIWESIGTQLQIEQTARQTGLYPLPSPKNTAQPISSTPASQISFINNMSKYAVSTEPHMYAQTIEAISDLSITGGQSIVALMREIRNKERLIKVGITLDNNIPDVQDQTLNNSDQKTLIANTPSNTNAEVCGYYDSTTDKYIITNRACGPIGAVDTGLPSEPGSLAGSPYRDLIPPNLNTLYTSSQLLPSTLSESEAIAEVTSCNCDCWDNL